MRSQQDTTDNNNTSKSGWKWKVVGKLKGSYPHSDDPTKTLDAPPFYESDTFSLHHEATKHLHRVEEEVIPQMVNGYTEIVHITDEALMVKRKGQTQTDYIYKITRAE